MAETSAQDAVSAAQRALEIVRETEGAVENPIVRALSDALDTPSVEWMVCVGGACERPEDDDLPLAEALDRATELMLEQERLVVVEGFDAEPVQVIGYTRRALEAMWDRAPR